jgi:hypothetical protein
MESTLDSRARGTQEEVREPAPELVAEESPAAPAIEGKPRFSA